MPDVIPIVVSFLSGSVGGSICGALVAHFLTKRRGEQRSKTAMIAFLNVWESEIADNRKTVNAANVRVSYADRFDSTKRQLIEKATEVRSKYRGTKLARFNGRIKAITDMTPGGVESAEGRQNLLDAIRNLAKFADKN